MKEKKVTCGSANLRRRRGGGVGGGGGAVGSRVGATVVLEGEGKWALM